jgi:hypothetical protein
LLVPDCIDEEITILAKRLVDTIHFPFYEQGHVINVSLSVGISFYPQHGDTVQDLKFKADAAMYRVKKMDVMVGKSGIRQSLTMRQILLFSLRYLHQSKVKVSYCSDTYQFTFFCVRFSSSLIKKLPKKLLFTRLQ